VSELLNSAPDYPHGKQANRESLGNGVGLDLARSTKKLHLNNSGIFLWRCRARNAISPATPKVGSSGSV
jgi:hypothetical protein